MKNRISPLEMKMNYNTGTVGVRDWLERDQDARKMIVFQEKIPDFRSKMTQNELFNEILVIFGLKLSIQLFCVTLKFEI